MADPEDARHEVRKMLPYLNNCDPLSGDVLLRYARRVTVAGLVEIRESIQRRGTVGVGYAVNAMKRYAKERNA